MITVILAEDHNVVRNGIKSLLEKAGGFKIVGEASNGKGVLDILQTGTIPNIILSDINMAGMGGLELATEVKASYAGIKTVFLTMLDNENFVSEAFNTGACGYLLKNITSDELVFALKHINMGKRYICSELSLRFLERLVTMPAFYNNNKATASAAFGSKDLEILELIADGHTNSEIADKLFMSKRTVEGYRKGLLEKTETPNSSALIRYAIQNGLIN